MQQTVLLQSIQMSSTGEKTHTISSLL